MRNHTFKVTPLASLVSCVLGLGSIAAVACSAPDPGVGYLGTSHNSANGGSSTTGNGGEDSGAASQGQPQTGGGSDSGTATTTNGDAGTPAAGDAGGGANDAAPAATTFLGEATPWAANQQPATTAFQAHVGAGQAQQTPTLDCLTCHVTGGAGSPFLAAGFVATAAGGTTGAVNVEVRAYGQGSDAGASGYTDSNGYFWINPPLGGITGPYNAAIRTSTAMQAMTQTQTAIDCQSSTCHGGGQGNIHL